MISWRKLYTKGLIAISLLLSTSALFSQDAQGDPTKGQTLFKTNCASCHALDKQLVGPQLGGVVDRVKKEQNLGQEWFQKWIKDNKALRTSGDKYANEIFAKFKNVEMPAFATLSDQDINDILAYTSNPPKEQAADNKQSTEDVEKAKKEKTASTIILLSLFSIGALLLWLLLKLKQLLKSQQTEELANLNATRIKSFSEFYKTYNGFAKVVLGVLAILAAYGLWNWLMWVGVYKGYKPDQPIYFSHRIHAGENKIDCQLCHSGAKYGKVSEIPSMNVCMNCHKLISEYKGKYMEPGKNKEFYDGEIKKIYEATGWDAANQVYTGKTQPVEWVRIHNMQDFVYFNHSQHVVAGENAILTSYNKKNPKDQIDVVCKACHGKIDTMNVVQMANDFTMGWCIECHRTTEVDMSNGYNKAYFEKLHKKLAKQYPASGGKITVDAVGGLECGKCHY